MQSNYPALNQKQDFLNNRADYYKELENYESSLADYTEALKLPNAPEYQKARAPIIEH